MLHPSELSSSFLIKLLRLLRREQPACSSSFLPLCWLPRAPSWCCLPAAIARVSEMKTWTKPVAGGWIHQCMVQCVWLAAKLSLFHLKLLMSVVCTPAPPGRMQWNVFPKVEEQQWCLCCVLSCRSGFAVHNLQLLKMVASCSRSE